MARFSTSLLLCLFGSLNCYHNDEPCDEPHITDESEHCLHEINIRKIRDDNYFNFDLSAAIYISEFKNNKARQGEVLRTKIYFKGTSEIMINFVSEEYDYLLVMLSENEDKSKDIYLDGFYYDEENIKTALKGNECASNYIDRTVLSNSHFISAILVLTKSGDMTLKQSQRSDLGPLRLRDPFIKFSCRNVNITEKAEMIFGTINKNNVVFRVDCPY
ncbi:hypothetical protein ACFFRR_008395 [Megaselia abdita]